MLYYHGSNTKINKFRLVENIRFSYGPGIYTTDQIKLAKQYGQNIHIVTLSTNKFYTEKDRPDRKIIEKIVNDTPSDVLKKINQDPVVARKTLVDDAMDNRNMADALFSVWHDAFQKYGVLFCQSAETAGVDGVQVKAASGTYTIVYNPDIIKLIDIQTV